ncbi:SCO7613 C-terminal domain-containing membrane protein [Glycomyces arizonensis]|uniref:SCO7613 C-terminal domain-containing membrane protein n=1 Tax=Glycomyces arizonensis TaxID=256035 RepID=UPI000422FB67|nr:hypothetical protein [Glycomyces arizonensis]
MSTQITPPHASGGPQAGDATRRRGGRAEITAKSVQVVLLCLGGLLLTAAVIVFTAVAWREMGDGGRLAILAGFTGLLLAVPMALTRFRLWATAETLAAIATLALWCSALAGYYLYLPAGTGLTAASVAAWTTPVLIGATGYRIAARVSSPGWALLPVAAAGASFAAVADVFEAALHMVVIGAVLAGAAWTVRALPTRHTRSDQWSARILACAAIVTVFLAGLRVAFGLDASLLSAVAAATCLAASAGALATVHVRREGASVSALAVIASTTGALVVAAWILTVRSADPAMIFPAFLLMAVVIAALAAWTDPDGPVWLPLAAAAASVIVSLGTLGVVLTDAYEATSYFGAAVLAAAVAPVFPAALRTALRRAAAAVGAAVLAWCAALALWTVPVAFGAEPSWLPGWEVSAIALVSAVGLPMVPKRWRLDFLTVIAAIAVLAAGGLWERPWAPAASFALVTAAALIVAIGSSGLVRRCIGWVGAYTWAAAAILAAYSQSSGDADPALFAFVGVAAGAVLLIVALTAPMGRGPDRVAARIGAHAFIGLHLLWSLTTVQPMSGEPLSVFVPAGFVVYAAALAVAAWAAPAYRVGHVFAAFGAATAAHLLLAARGGVADLEYYTVPPAVLLFGIGLWLLRRDPERGSWTALAPALAVGFGPSLALSFGPDGEPLRRVLVGAAALAVLLVASARRWQAPLVIGALVLAALSVNELVLLWGRVPKWIPLAVGGAVLITAGATLEQRRRDLARLRNGLKEMR